MASYDPTIPFIGSVKIGTNPVAGATDVFLGTVIVLSSVPNDLQGKPLTNPYLGTVHNVLVAPAGANNPTLGQVVIVGSAPAGTVNDPFLGDVIEG